MTYTVRQRLGRGGMGVVDLAVDDRGRLVALKRLALHGSADEMWAARRRVRREAEALFALEHPSVIGLLDVVDEDDDVVLVMPYLPGGSLADRVRSGGPLPPEQVESLAAALGAALAAAHRRGIVHRDVKPSNVLFDDQGRPVLADFGVARLRDATSGLTLAGSVVGTPDFLAPELARGEVATPASDVFGLGATLLFAATGQGPWGSGDAGVLVARAARGRPSGLGELPRPLARQVRPMLARSPQRRPALAPSLAPGPEGTAVDARRRAQPDDEDRPGRLWAGAVAGAVAAAALVAGALALADRETGSAATPAAPSTTACEPLPYQPCGQPVAAGTDGSRCVEGRADYDGEPANGCEAVPDERDGEQLDGPLQANLVPGDDVDVYPMVVTDELHLFCDGRLDVSLTAPAGATMRLEVLRRGELLDRVTSADGEEATASVGESCFGDDGGTLQARVTWVGERRTGETYLLEHRGSF